VSSNYQDRHHPKEKTVSNLLKHAEYELKKAGWFNKGSDYDGMIGKAVMRLMKVHAKEGHSGGSHALVLQVFNTVANFKTLSPLTADPKEWMEIGSTKLNGEKVWQSTRQHSCFSNNGGKTWYDIDDPKSRATRAEMARRRQQQK
jgi:hypothetical protein